jgi:hypothetical protein
VAAKCNINVTKIEQRESHLAWVSAEFAQCAETVFQSLEGVPKITMDNSWDVFELMSIKMESM